MLTTTVALSEREPASSITKQTKGRCWEPNWKAKVEIIKNGELLKTFIVNNPLVKLSYTDFESITGASYGRESCIKIGKEYFLNKYSENPLDDPDELQTNGVDFYLIRIVGDNGRHTYIGPIWVESLT